MRAKPYYTAPLRQSAAQSSAFEGKLNLCSSATPSQMFTAIFLMEQVLLKVFPLQREVTTRSGRNSIDRQVRNSM